MAISQTYHIDNGGGGGQITVRTARAEGKEHIQIDSMGRRVEFTVEEAEDLVTVLSQLVGDVKARANAEMAEKIENSRRSASAFPDDK